MCGTHDIADLISISALFSVTLEWSRFYKISHSIHYLEVNCFTLYILKTLINGMVSKHIGKIHVFKLSVQNLILTTAGMVKSTGDVTESWLLIFILISHEPLYAAIV